MNETTLTPDTAETRSSLTKVGSAEQYLACCRDTNNDHDMIVVSSASGAKDINGAQFNNHSRLDDDPEQSEQRIAGLVEDRRRYRKQLSDVRKAWIAVRKCFNDTNDEIVGWLKVLEGREKKVKRDLKETNKRLDQEKQFLRCLAGPRDLLMCPG